MKVPHQATGVARDGWRGASRSDVSAADLALASRVPSGSAGAIGGVFGRGGSGLGFSCNPLYCSCSGDAD